MVRQEVALNPRFLSVAQDPRLIPGVHHHCDQWCDYCPVTDRCLVFRCTAEWRKQLRRSAEDIPFATAEEAVTFTREVAEAEGMTPEMMAARHSTYRSQIAIEDPLAALAWEYAAGAAKLLASVPFGACADAPHPGSPAAVEIVAWYHVLIYVKVVRALGAREHAASNGHSSIDDGVGNAKVALIAIQRSRLALPALVIPANRRHVEWLHAALDSLERGIDDCFPRARSFVRIGLDVPAAA